MAVNEQTQKDTNKARAQTEKDSAPPPSTMDQREAAAGLNLAGNDTMSGRPSGISIPTMDQRDSAAGLNDTTAGRNDSFYAYQQPPSEPWQSVDSEAFAPMSPMEFRDDEAVSSSELGFYFYFADETDPLFLPFATVLADYNPQSPDNHTDWSIKFPVSGSAIDTSGMPASIEYDSTTTRYDGDASVDPVVPQTFYRLPVIRGVDFGDGLEPQTVSSGGVYRENIFCDASKGSITEMIKIA